MRISRLARAFALASVALAVLLTPALLFAHARLVRSTPAANASLTTPPSALSLWFSEKPELRFTTIELTDSAGNAVALGAASMTTAGSMGVTVPVQGTLAGGRYSVSWRTAAADGHATNGRFTFTLAPQASPPRPTAVPATPATSATSPPTPRPAQTLSRTANAPITGGQGGMTDALRWAELIALLTAIGAVVFRLFVLPEADLPHALRVDASDRARRLGTAVLVLFAFATLTRLLAQSDLVPGAANDRAAAAMTVIRDTRWGHGWLTGAIGTVVAFFALIASRRWWWMWITAGAGVVAIAFAEGLTGHAGTVHHASLSLASDLAHVLGVGGWMGGLATLVLCGLPAMRGATGTEQWVAGSKLLRAYHRAAVECVVLVIASAILSAWLRLGTVSELWATFYGRLLLAKIALFALLTVLARYHQKTVVVPDWTAGTESRFMRTAAFELFVGAVVVAVTAVLVSSAFPAQ